jgi:hypothetical protein
LKRTALQELHHHRRRQMSLRRDIIASPNYSSRGSNVRLIVIHTAEGALTYQALGNYFKSPSAGVSSHTGIDDTPGVIGEYVARTNKAWTQANANPYSDATELCAFASWSRDEWDRHPTMLSNCAAWIAEESAAFGIPIRKLSSSEAQGGAAGVCGHVDLGASGGGHWDPGPSFPWERVITEAQGGTVTLPAVQEGEDMIANTSSGKGYWIVKPDGALYAFGDAQFRGGPNNPNVVPKGHVIVGIAGVGNDGYRIVADEGSVYCYGSADYYGRPDR